MKIEGSQVLVTGGSSGIGAALAPMLAERGATVGIVARRRDRLAQVLEECRRHAPKSAMWVADLGNVDLAEEVALDAWSRFGHLDVLVNNAGIPKRRHASELTYEELDHTMRVNFMGPARMMIAVLPKMLERRSGMIVNVSSTAGRLGNANESAYSASKFALCGWSEATAADLWGTGVQVRLVNPGPIDTEIWDLPENEDPLFNVEKVSSEEMAEGIIGSIEGDSFELYLPDMKPFVDAKNANIDKFLADMGSMAKSIRKKR